MGDGSGQRIVIPYKPRALQKELHNRSARFGVYVCHRRFGKTVAMVNELIKGALTCPRPNPRFGYLAPFFRQAKQIAWDYAKHYTRPIPGTKVNEAELRIDLPNGGRISLYGADNPDSLRGLYFDGLVLDEYAQMSPRVWEEVLRPALSDREGWAVFIGTPKGHNQFHKIYEDAAGLDEWTARMYRASETGILPDKELESARAGMSEDLYAQEYECSWSAAIQGAYYGKLIETAENDKRVGYVAHDPHAKVETWWDLGIGDPTAIWFAQRIGQEIHLIDYYESSGEPLSHYVEVVRSKKGYVYGDHVFPHDAKQRELQTGKSREEALKALGLEPRILPQHRLEDGIEEVRRILPRCWFDQDRCQAGLDALRQYRADYDERRGTYRDKPLHDWTSHGSDAFRYGAMHAPTQREWFDRKIEYDNRGIV